MTNDLVRCGVHVDRIVFAEVSPGTVAANATWYQGLVGEEVVPLVIAGSIVLQAEDCEGGNYFRHWFELGCSVGRELKNKIPRPSRRTRSRKNDTGSGWLGRGCSTRR